MLYNYKITMIVRSFWNKIEYFSFYSKSIDMPPGIMKIRESGNIDIEFTNLIWDVKNGRFMANAKLDLLEHTLQDVEEIVTKMGFLEII